MEGREINHFLDYNNGLVLCKTIKGLASYQVSVIGECAVRPDLPAEEVLISRCL